jgi:hypothetical protein
MKPRTLILATQLSRYVATLLGLAVMIVVAAEGVNAVVCCIASERQE